MSSFDASPLSPFLAQAAPSFQLFLPSRKLRDIASSLISPPSILKYLNSFSNTLWPGGVKREPSVPRTEEQKRRTKADANKKLASLMPGESSCFPYRFPQERGKEDGALTCFFHFSEQTSRPT